MKREELLAAVKERLYQDRNTSGDGKEEPKSDDLEADLQSKTKDDLYKLASERAINGRSNMSKTELMSALAHQANRSSTNASV